MASPKAIIQAAIGDDSAIKTLIANAFATRNMLHLAHWDTKSFATHLAVGDLYDSIIENIDEIVETYQGKFGLLSNLAVHACTVPKDICAHVKEEAKWVEDNQNAICRGVSSISNLVDNLVGSYHKTIYKLENLH